MTMKVAVYVRISTDKQELENQLKPLIQYAEKHGYEIVEIYKY